jgi:hypothetical protein
MAKKRRLHHFFAAKTSLFGNRAFISCAANDSLRATFIWLITINRLLG